MDPAFMVLEPSGLSNCRPCLTWEGHELGPWDSSHDWTVAYVNRFIETNNQPKFSLVRISLMCHAGLDVYKSFLPILLGSQAEESDGRLHESAVKRASFPRALRSGGVHGSGWLSRVGIAGSGLRCSSSFVTGDLLVFAGVIALGQFSPGPDMLLLTRTALAHGRSAGWRMSAGIASGLCVHATIAVFGMSYLMGLQAGLTEVLRWVAAAYLAYLGSRLLISGFGAGRGQAGEEEANDEGCRSAYLRGLLCNLLNPKVAIIFAAVVTEFVDGDRPAWWAPSLWLIIVGQGIVLWALYVWLLQFPPVRSGYQKAAPGFDIAFGTGLLALGLLIIIDRSPL